MSRDSLLPPKQLAAIVAALYTDADDAGWAHLPSAERTRLYRQWIDDPRVGRILTRFMTPEQARSWIKDGPMKEYANARRGTGRYARFGRHGGTGADEIAVAALGTGACVVDGTEGVKPPHCKATDAAGESAYLAWGEATNFRNLLWATLRVSVTENVAAHMVVLEPPGQTTPSADSNVHHAMARRCGLYLHYLPEVIGQARGRCIGNA